MFISQIWLYVAIFAVAGLLSFFATPLVIVFAKRIGAIDIPKDNRRMHSRPIPRLGGLAIFFGFMVAVLLLTPVRGSEMIGILLGAVCIVGLGVVDDMVALSPKTKLLGQLLAAGIAVAGGLRIQYIANFLPFLYEDYISFGVFAIPITVLWIVGITNAVNLIDGLDGLAVGVSSIASICMVVIALIASDANLAMVMLALTGACLGFLPYNFNPAKIFMGDTGAMFLGYLLATMSVHGLFKFYALLSFFIPFVLLALPIFDTAYAIIRRLAQGRSPFSPDRGHLHHKLIDMGFSQKQSVAILYTLSAVLGVCAVLISTTNVHKVLFLVLGLAVVSVLSYRVFQKEYHKRRAQLHTGSTPPAEEPPKENQ